MKLALNKKQTEEAGIAGLKQYLIDSPYIDSELPTNDKTPSFDGSLTLYSKPGLNKKDMKGIAPVQVKSITSKKILKNRKYPVKVADLKNYYNQRGVLYFVVYVNPKDVRQTKIYYKDMLLFDIKEALKGKEEQTIITIQFEKIDENVSDFRLVLENFLYHQDFQSKFSLQHVQEKTPTSFVMKWIGEKGNNMKYMQKNSVFLYANDGNLLIPVKRIKPEEIQIFTQSEEESVVLKTKNSFEFSGKKIILNNSIIEIVFGQYNENYLEVNTENGTVRFKTKLKGDINNILNCLIFMDDLNKNGSLNINGHDLSSIKATYDEVTGSFDSYEEALNFFRDLKTILSDNKIPLDINFFELPDKDIEQLNDLVNNYVFPGEDGLVKYEFGGYILHILTVNKNVMNIFDNKLVNQVRFSIKVNGEYINTVPYVFLDTESIIHSPYINFLAIKDSIKDLNLEQMELRGSINWLALNFISAYDQKEEKEFLELAYGILEELPDSNEEQNTLLLINKAQILKRRKRMTPSVYKDLLVALDNCKDDPFLQFGIYLLLDDNVKVNEIFSTFDENFKKDILEMPISVFMEDNLIV
ncbi:DUF4365 domain-containing protein [Listeria cossartiae subsp. cayugensis]|uniref:DUF4365 domain-containing protein n=1 Tax=Listeria cossartiae TaxID=2838249 RepID=UPI002880841D|nr:DUF4365 domain-containing protein [Listeria cossartiae]MDT0003527.1 DUF4365 domain-containing protein [Listeria cossartiae subsp. cayugensis]MDT0019921.1 DUF4365 domain-containing protein [Listeria cossartiae subsp. cayugensis]MDT0036801.1 DUF4365 domain-containing protein [Listeria cossartiae subsp. cayugensis]MDT0041672.1 DUF4365 domain-containing protein [Listeria cossartiae subsp. cayugensis]MDT0047023.1 DUF4365 domain-containing protein [Listeria cossartiae subsp. cayugensis]